MSVNLKKAIPNDNKWNKLLYKLEILVDRLERLLDRVKT
jgi:hypothetical protein